MIIFVQSQQWTGTFTADSTCSRSVCCCLDGSIVVTRPSTNILAMSSGLSGQCGTLTTFATTSPYPSGYSGYVTLSGTNLTLTLSSDSNTIAAVNPSSSACNGNARRNAAIQQFGNVMAMMVLVFTGMMKVVF